ncbi:helix-turn-helix domain-containing protein [Nocardioides perillae]|uniref:Transcriptional regulator with XRE-family HTH domain n=1 Tax=Nocardioides perillae TaxID=1119534 RepID=A0A7Y9RXI4_9ACTN|nr:transcriptional regulator with XRE-family HTH domain [Nocardioides perillae]
MSTRGASTGARVRAARTERGLSLSALAAAAGIGKATLSDLEAGRRNPTLDTLYAVAGPLGVPLAALVDDERGAVEVGDGDLTSRRLHVQHDDDVTTEVYLVRVRPGGARTSPAHAVGAHERLVVLSGTGELEVAGHVVELAPGTQHGFAADVAHTYRCTSRVELVAVDVIRTPVRPPGDVERPQRLEGSWGTTLDSPAESE